MIQLKPTQLYAVKVPESATEIELYNVKTSMSFRSKKIKSSYLLVDGQMINLSENHYELIGTYQSGKIDFDAGEYVDWWERDALETKWIDYKNEEGFFGRGVSYSKTPESSFQSLLEANQVPIRDNEKYVILKLK